MAAAFGGVFEEVACTGGEGLFVPVFATDRKLKFAELFAESAGSVVEGLDGATHDTGVVVFGHVAVVLAVGAVAHGDRGCGDKEFVDVEQERDVIGFVDVVGVAAADA